MFARQKEKEILSFLKTAQLVPPELTSLAAVKHHNAVIREDDAALKIKSIRNPIEALYPE